MIPPMGLGTLAKEFTVTNRVMQSSSNELSTPVYINVNVTKRKINTYTLNSNAYFAAVGGCKIIKKFIIYIIFQITVEFSWIQKLQSDPRQK